MFCPKCGSILLPRKEGSKKILACSCGYKSNDIEQTKITETITSNRKEVEVVDRQDYETFPTIKIKCEKCGHGLAYYWTLQTRSGDEPETKFLKCQKCQHTWRDYN